MRKTPLQIAVKQTSTCATKTLGKTCSLRNIHHLAFNVKTNNSTPNPYWLASAPPTDKAYNVLRALEAGWGGIVWKTLGTQVKNVSSRYSSVDFNGTRMMGFNNIELISDRPLDLN